MLFNWGPSQGVETSLANLTMYGSVNRIVIGSRKARGVRQLLRYSMTRPGLLGAKGTFAGLALRDSAMLEGRHRIEYLSLHCNFSPDSFLVCGSLLCRRRAMGASMAPKKARVSLPSVF